MAQQVKRSIRFELDDVPTMPGRTRSGALIDARVTRALSRQLAAEQAAHSALDKLINLLRDYASRFPAPDAGRYSFHKP